MANEYYYAQLIRKNSWWHSVNAPVRTFVISDLPYDLKDGEIIYDRVGLLEYGFDGPKWISYNDFKAMVENQQIRPMNVLPNLPK